MYRRSSTNIHHFVQIVHSTWPPEVIQVSELVKCKKEMCAFENNWQIETKFGRDDAVRTKITRVSFDHATWPPEAIKFPVWSNRK